MVGLKVAAILSDVLQMNGFCLVVEFHWKRSDTNGATPSSFIWNSDPCECNNKMYCYISEEESVILYATSGWVVSGTHD